MTDTRLQTGQRPADPEAPGKLELALQALSKLTRQFADRPDFEQLVEILMLTLTGQFAVTNAFSVLKHPGFPSAAPLYLGSGKFKHERSLERLIDECGRLGAALTAGTPYRVADLNVDPTGTLVQTLIQNRVAVVVPLQHQGKLFGLIGLGEKINRRPFTDDEMDLFATLSNTVTPLIASSFLFLEIANLNHWYHGILNNVRQGVFVFDADLLLKKINVAGFEIIRSLAPDISDPANLQGIELGDLFPDHAYPGWARRLKTPGRTQDSRLLENLVARTDQVERIFNVRSSVTDGETTHQRDMIITLDDVSAQKENEHRLYNLEKFAEKGMMASSISHELNNFLALLLGGVELAQAGLKMGNMERVQSSLERLNVSVQRMDRFTAGLMDSARLDSAKKVVHLNSVIEEVLTFVAVQKRFKRIRVESNLDGAVQACLMDADQISQLLLNFLNNAADSILEADREEGVIEVRTCREGQSIHLFVQDNGAGIPPEVQSRLFKQHFTTKEKGHGYGMMTCARIIAAHLATCSVQSEIGKGTTFRVTFPEEAGSAGAGSCGMPSAD